MSTMCDSCKQPMQPDDGCARIMITDPSPDYSSVSVENLPTFRRPPALDVCAACLLKLVTALSLPPDTFTPRPPRVEPAVPTPAGALTEEDLIKLGLKDNP